MRVATYVDSNLCCVSGEVLPDLIIMAMMCSYTYMNMARYTSCVLGTLRLRMEPAQETRKERVVASVGVNST